ncbi:hypothetical protein P879_12038 [Paragonimus westermani]|uniref:Reverse transcriptase domain-containing protein n=1 Tax=Paragonimus westermani TaxID=34504 RepID=A0A8T0D707_9TREM|nr:hypothetical protein P879_12038 [Paragonimus westermani]
MMGSVSSEAVLYQRLAAKFVGRSAEGVKKRLIKVNWSGVSKHRTEVNVPKPRDEIQWSSDEDTVVNISRDDSILTVIDVEQLEEERWRGTMLDTIINSLIKINEPRIRSSDLLAIARSVKFGRVCDDTARSNLETIINECFPKRWKFKPRRTPILRKSLGTRAIGRLNYAALQRLYHTRRKDAANSALDEPWSSAYKREVTLPLRMKEHWKEIFEIESKPDLRPVVVNKYEWNVIAAISREETEKALRDSKGTAPGVDRFQTGDFLKWNLEVVTQLLNLMLVLESPTAQLSLARLTFVPKIDEPVTPTDYRPIVVSFVLQRMLHKILAKRVRDTVSFSSL